MAESLSGYFLGKRPYTPVFSLMQELFELRRKEEVGDLVLLLEHLPVITLGRGSQSKNLLTDEAELKRLGISINKTGRGGDVTLHAPGQLIAYPIIKLSPDRQDVRKYVKGLTDTMKDLVALDGIDAGTVEGRIGLWVDRNTPSHWPGEQKAQELQKIGAIGVRISRWITSHGFALNLTTDLSYFQHIIPCGITEYGVTTVRELTGRSPEILPAARAALQGLNQRFGLDQAAFHDLRDESFTSIFQLVRDSKK